MQFISYYGDQVLAWKKELPTQLLSTKYYITAAIADSVVDGCGSVVFHHRRISFWLYNVRAQAPSVPLDGKGKLSHHQRCCS